MSNPLFQPLELPCGVSLENRLVKSAMSDSLGDGRGNPTNAQIRLYERWAEGGIAASIVGEVQGTSAHAEKPGNLVLNHDSDQPKFAELAKHGASDKTQLWLQLGHAGAMAHAPISLPKGPSAIEIDGLRCEAMTIQDIQELPNEFARTAGLAQQLGFGGVQIHAAHGFLLSQFLSPLFNKRKDNYGGTSTSRMRLLLEVVEAVRGLVDPTFVVSVKLNATDQLDGGFEERDALKVISALDKTGIDFIDVSGGTYFPGAKSSSERTSSGPYFLDFASHARKRTSIPIMLTGGFKTRQQAIDAIHTGNLDLVGVARALILDHSLPKYWQSAQPIDPEFPRFNSNPEGGVTAWYTLRMTDIALDKPMHNNMDLDVALKNYNKRDNDRLKDWTDQFGSIDE